MNRRTRVLCISVEVLTHQSLEKKKTKKTRTKKPPKMKKLEKYIEYIYTNKKSFYVKEPPKKRAPKNGLKKRKKTTTNIEMEDFMNSRR